MFVFHSDACVYEIVSKETIAVAFIKSTYRVVQVDVGAQVRPKCCAVLYFVDAFAVLLDRSAIVDGIRAVVDQSDVQRPFRHLRCPVGISLIASVMVQTSSQLHEVAVRIAILIVVSSVEGKYLPSQTSTTSLVVPSEHLGVEHILCQLQPGLDAAARGWSWESFLRCGHGGECPEGLVVITLRLSLVRRHVIIIWSYLEEQAFGDDVVVGVVASHGPVVDERIECHARVPPVIGRREDTGNERSVAAIIDADDVCCNCLGGAFDGLGIVQVDVEREAERGAKQQAAGEGVL